MARGVRRCARAERAWEQGALHAGNFEKLCQLKIHPSQHHYLWKAGTIPRAVESNEDRNKAGPDRSLNSSAGIELRGMVLGCSLCSAYFRDV